MKPQAPAILEGRATWFDGRTTRRRSVRLQLSQHALRLLPLEDEGEATSIPSVTVDAAPVTPGGAAADAGSIRYSLRALKPGEAWLDAPLSVLLPDKGMLWLEHEGGGDEATAFASALVERVAAQAAASTPLRASRLIDSWPAVIACLVATVALLVWFDRRGAAVVATAALHVVPKSVDRGIGDSAMETISQQWLRPTGLPEARQLRLKRRFAEAAARVDPDDAVELRFHRMRGGRAVERSSEGGGGGDGGGYGGGGGDDHDRAHDDEHADDAAAGGKGRQPRRRGDDGGFNAFALPNGTIVVLDGLANALSDDELMAVLGHELGHVAHRHGMKGVMRSMGLLTVASVALGDFSTVVASSVATIQSFHYSRDDEREADAFGARFAEAAGLPAGTIASMWRKLQKEEQRAGAAGIPPWMSTHPSTDERIKAAQGR